MKVFGEFYNIDEVGEFGQHAEAILNLVPLRRIRVVWNGNAGSGFRMWAEEPLDNDTWAPYHNRWIAVRRIGL